MKTKNINMLDIHVRIAKHSSYGAYPKDLNIFENEFQGYIDKIDAINVEFCAHAYKAIVDAFPEIEQNTELKKAVIFGVSSHINRNLLYDGKPYFVHLSMVYVYALKYAHLLPAHVNVNDVLCAIWLHDTIEDCPVTYNDLRKHFNKIVANIVYALSNEKGKSREERANIEYLMGIRGDIRNIFAKYCDRLANITYSRAKKSDMYDKYKEEHKEFTAFLEVNPYDLSEMVAEMAEILKIEE